MRDRFVLSLFTCGIIGGFWWGTVWSANTMNGAVIAASLIFGSLLFALLYAIWTLD